MFYAHFVLNKKGPLARIWLAAHWDKKLTRAHVFETNISSSVEAILEPKLKMALRTSGHLLLGVVRIYSRKAKYLLADCNEAFVKIKMAFRPGVVDLPDEANREAAIAAITLPENIHDFEATIADLNEINMNTIAINQSRPEDITMREDFGEINLGRQDDDFGDSVFDEPSSREVIREGDKTYSDGIYRPSDQLSVRGGPDFSLRSDQDIDATLIGGDHLVGLQGRQPKHGDLNARTDDIGIDDNDFGDGFLGAPDDDDENFGGEIDHSLFTDVAIFEDPSAQKQLENLTSEIESHMDTARFNLHDGTTPIPVASGDAVDLGAPGQPVTTTAGHLIGDRFLATAVTATGDSVSETNLTCLPAVSLTVSRLATSTVHGESTTLLTNESEAFALPPIDATAVASTEPRRVGKRKRRLIVDELKSIPSETMKLQMEDTSEITTQLDLAPPTKKLMHWKETGSVDKLFTLPGRAIPSRILQRLFVCNLHTVPIPDDAPEEQLFIPCPIKVGFVPLTAPSTMTETAPDQVATHVSHPSNVVLPASKSPDVPFPTEAPSMHKQLDVIREISEDTSNHLSAGREVSDFDQVHDPMVHGQDDFDDGNMHDDLAFMGEPPTPYMPPPSVLSEAPPSVIRADMLALERELAEADDEAENQLALAFASAHPESAALLSGGTTPIPAGAGGAADGPDQVTVESLEERRLEKRSKVLLRMLHAHQQQFGWDGPLSLQSICAGNTKKQAASKFYTVLLLRKQGAVDLKQEAAYSDILISRGPNFNHLLDV